ncbi:MAG: hypothetical protein WCK13_06875 [Ignavibacteriota bacterium]
MEEFTQNKRALQKLKEYDAIENLQASEEWNKSLMKRIESTNPRKNSELSSFKLAVIALLIIINLGFVLRLLISDSSILLQRKTDLQVISKELLINFDSINN